MMLSEDVVKCRFELAASWAAGMLSENVGLWPYRMLKFEEVYLLGWVLDMKLLEIDNYISKLVTDRRERSKQEKNQ